MKTYIGVKLVKMQEMNRADYNDFRGWELPEDEDGADEGYLIEYLDGGKPNTNTHQGYVSWSPKEQADNAYRQVDGMSFGLALEALKKGFRVQRAGWNGKNMWIVYMSGMTLPPYNTQGTERKVTKYIGEDTPLVTLPYIAMWTADKKWLPGWLASQTDMLADDWRIVE